MKAIGYYQSLDITSEQALMDLEIPKVQATGRDLLVQVRAVSVNPVDTKIRANVAPESNQPKVLGWDAVGTVVGVGEDVSLFSVGDEVWYAGDLTRPGSNAEYQCVDERIVALKPKSLSHADSASLPLTAITAWELIFDRLQLDRYFADHKKEPTVLIIGAAGGVGSVLIQLIKQLVPACVIATASRPTSQEWVKSLGADKVISHHESLSEQIANLNTDEVTHVISLNQTEDHFDAIAELIAPQGKLALIDDPKTPLDVMKLKRKSVSLHWEFMYTRSMFQTADITKQHDLLTAVAQLIDQGKLRTTLGEHYGPINADNLRRAHAQIESGTTIGKIVLEGF